MEERDFYQPSFLVQGCDLAGGVKARVQERGEQRICAVFTRPPITRAGKPPKVVLDGVLAKLGVPVTCTDIFGKAGPAWLDGLRMPQPYGGKVTSLRHLAGELATEPESLRLAVAAVGRRGEL